MKYKTTLIAASTLFAFTGLSMAGDKDGKCATGEKCATEKCDTVSATGTNFVVEGMTCGKCSTKLTTALEAIDGVTVKSVCHKSGHAVVDIDASKTSKEKVAEAIKATGFKVAGEEVAMHVSGMTCAGCSKKLTSSLAALEGVNVKSVCHKSGNVVVTINSQKADESKVQAAITKAGFKVDTAKS